MRVEDLRPIDLFDGLTDDQVAALVDGGEEVAIVPGADLFREGAPADHWWVLVDGTLDLLRQRGREEVVVAQMDVPGRWAGGFRAWDPSGVYLATARGRTPGRVLRVPAETLRDLAAAWSPFGGHLIDGLFHTARSIESTARQHSALVTLGTLAAGLAHEINNPASAAARAVDGLVDAKETVLSSLRLLADRGITAAQFTALDELRLAHDPLPADTSALLRSDREQALGAWLDGHGIAKSWEIASAVVAAGLDTEWCDRVADAVPPAALEAALDWLAGQFTVAALLTETKEATRRISELVAAVRSYSQVDRASKQNVDLTEGLESTLVVLGHKLRGGVTVERDYGPDVPPVAAYPGELNQVWTNLMDNAVDAMAGVGRLRIGTLVDDDHVVVEIEDTGAGMPPEVAARAFEAFYTTKDVGAGTGLGLDIARRIVVERHRGDIDIDSVPGRTVIRVRLPIAG
ncbi:sensor histidine kinase [Nocardioides sp. LHG3406-4]|uniref:sensor histidine kinase n=1 Tax=Nocardioides sp. LHG3406-4 TaxID=2804575 RepID=UPI003CF99111